MQTSLFDLFKIGIGPSSSHTVGPMRSAYEFVRQLSHQALLPSVARVRVKLYGSLALTGYGHGTDRGVLLGLLGKRPDEVDPAEIEELIATIRGRGQIALFHRREVPFEPGDRVFHKDAVLPGHSNGMRFTAFDRNGSALDTRVYYSIGGGFIREEGEERSTTELASVPYPFKSATELLAIGEHDDLPIHLVMLTNEMTWRSAEKIRDGIRQIWGVMSGCIQRVLETHGELPGGLRVQRRAAKLALGLKSRAHQDLASSKTIKQ